TVWVDHLWGGDAGLVDLLERSGVLMHPFVVGELACGNLRGRESILELLQGLPAAVVASPEEVLTFIGRHRLHGKGIGHVDAHLLASVALTPGARLWTRDARLRRMAGSLGCVHSESAH
ncbi:MAG: VapC toxin family PIN domain ribonuclease, partial [Rubrivivax sp.]